MSSPPRQNLWWVFLHELMHGAYSIYDLEYKNGPSPDEDVWTFLYEWKMDPATNTPYAPHPTIIREITGSEEVEIERADGTTETISVTNYGKPKEAILPEKEGPHLRRLFKSHRIRYDEATGELILKD